MEEGRTKAADTTTATTTTDQGTEMTTSQYTIRLLVCIVGLQGSYLTWGILQVYL